MHACMHTHAHTHTPSVTLAANKTEKARQEFLFGGIGAFQGNLCPMLGRTIFEHVCFQLC